jgi:hypothetical protein
MYCLRYELLFLLHSFFFGGTAVREVRCWLTNKSPLWGENRLPAIACKPSGGMELGALACASLWQPDGLVKWTEVP